MLQLDYPQFVTTVQFNKYADNFGNIWQKRLGLNMFNGNYNILVDAIECYFYEGYYL